jgi:hypothetical protein
MVNIKKYDDPFQPPKISFADYVRMMNLNQDRIEHLKFQFGMSKHIHSIVMDGKRGEMRVLRPDDL